MNRRAVLQSLVAVSTSLAAGCTDQVEVRGGPSQTDTSRETPRQTDAATATSTEAETRTGTETATQSGEDAVIARTGGGSDVFQSGTVRTAPDELTAGETVSVTGEVTVEIPDAEDNIVYGAVGTPGGDLYGLQRMAGTGSGTVTVSAALPADAAGESVIWTFIPAVSDREARRQFGDEAGDGRYESGELAIPLGTVTGAGTATPSARITRETQGTVFQSGTVTDAPDEFNAGESVSVTGEVAVEIPDAEDNIVYGAVGTPGGDLYGLQRMDGMGSGTVTVTASIPQSASGSDLIWTFIPAVSEREARQQFDDEAAEGRYQSGELAVSLGTVTAAETPTPRNRITRGAEGAPFQSGTVTDAPDEFSAGETISVTGEVETERDNAEDNIVYGAIGTPDGELYGLERMPSMGSGTVTVSASIPESATGADLIWTFIPAVSEREARQQFDDEAAEGRYQPGDLAVSLGSVE